MIDISAVTDEEGIELVRTNLRGGLDQLLEIGWPRKWIVGGLEATVREMRREQAAND